MTDDLCGTGALTVAEKIKRYVDEIIKEMSRLTVAEQIERSIDKIGELTLELNKLKTSVAKATVAIMLKE